MPLSKALMGLGVLWLVVNWILERDYKRKLRAFWENKAAVVFSSLMVLHLIGLLYTSDFEYGFKDIRIKAPILVMPIIFCGMPKLEPLGIKKLLLVFVGACVAGSFASYAVLFEWIDTTKIINDGRDLALFISHIRLSLFLALSVFILGYYASKDALKWKVLYIGMIAWILAYMWVIESPTGFIVLLVGSLVILIFVIWTQKNVLLRLTSVVLFFALPLGAFLFVKSCYDEYYTIHEDKAQLATHTAGGEEYMHVLDSEQLENGYYVYCNLAKFELERSWTRRSKIHFDSLDHANQPIGGTVIRYLTSKGLKKDSVGVYALTEADIALIESGVANVNYNKKKGIHKRIDQIIFEFDIWSRGGNPSGNSLTMKLEIWRTAKEIIKENMWFGVGTGDVRQAFDEQYAKMDSRLDEDSRLRGHNQYITMFIAFGIFGLIWFLITIFYPLFKLRMQYDYLYMMFFVSVVLSYISEDTLETQAGLTYFVIFSCLFLFARTGIPIRKSE